MKILYFVLQIVILSSIFISAEPLVENDLLVDSVKSTAMGGFHAGLADDVDVLFSNPAGFRAVKEQLRFTQLSIGLHGPVFDITNLVIQSVNGEREFDELIEEEENLALLRSLYAGTTTTGPLSFCYLGGGIGFGFFNTSGMLFRTPSALSLEAKIYEELSLLGGYTFGIPIDSEKHTLDTGVILKGFFRGESVIKTNLLLVSGLLEDLGSDFVNEQPFDLITGIGFDLGIRYTFNDIITFGLVGQDIYTPTLRSSYATLDGFYSGEDTTSTQNGIVPLKVNSGITVTPPLGVLSQYFSGFSFSLDYNDAFDFLMYPETATNPILHFGTGAELTILDILSIRGGMNEGLFSAGLGVKLGIADIGLSMYGREISSEPGLKPVYNVLLGVDIER